MKTDIQGVNGMEIRVEHIGDIVVIHLAGSFNIDTVARAQETLLGEADTGGSLIAVYCEKLKSLDSSAIGFLVKFFKLVKERGISLVMCDLNELIYRIFVTARLDRFFTIMKRGEFEERYLAKKQEEYPR